MVKALNTFYSLLLVVILSSCGGEDFSKPPIDDIIRDMPSDRVFSIALHDMDVKGTFFNDYFHQYKIVQEKEPGKPEEYITGWSEVSKDYFKQHVNDMGMVIASRDEDGKLNKTVSPPGYNNYIGNKKYGHWNNSGGSSFWQFYGQYAFMSSMFNLGNHPVRRSYYDDYRGGYYGTGRAYYGPTVSGSRYYGTNSAYTRSTRSNSTWSKNTSSFKQRVSNRTSRSGSRYGGSSSRSRGGGFGK